MNGANGQFDCACKRVVQRPQLSIVAHFLQFELLNIQVAVDAADSEKTPGRRQTQVVRSSLPYLCRHVRTDQENICSYSNKPPCVYQRKRPPVLPSHFAAMNLRTQAIALQTILTKEILRFLRIWIQTILPPAITTALYFIIFGKLIGARLGAVDGLTYSQYIAPGLIMMAVITNAYSNVVSSFFSAKFQRHIEEMLVSPLPNAIIVLGFVGGGAARGLAVGLVVTAVSLFFADLHWQHPLLTLVVIVLTSVLFSLGGLINGIFAKSFDDISLIPTFVLTPLTYFGGIFYSVKMLPPFWQDASLFNPILYMVNAFRFGILGVSDINIVLAVALILLLIVSLFSYSLWLLHRGTGIRN